MAKERFKPCSRCGKGRVMTDELRRDFNAKGDDGKIICSDCKIMEIYDRFGL